MHRVVSNDKNSRATRILRMIPYSIIHVFYAFASIKYLANYMSIDWAIIVSFTLFNMYQVADTIVLKDKRPLQEYVEYNLGLLLYELLS